LVRFDFSDYLSLRSLAYWRGLLWRSQYWPASRLRDLQWKLLASQLDHCYSEVPYYRDVLSGRGVRRSDFRSLEDLVKMPVIGKQDVFRQGDAFKAERFERYRPKAVPTSGTTGTPMTVYWDLSSNVLELLCQWRHYSWYGYRLGDAFLDIRNYHTHLGNDPWSWNWKCRGLETSIFFWNASNAAECAAMLRKRRIRLWRGNPLALSQLARIFEEAGIRDIRPRCVVSVGEALLRSQREMIEGWSGVRVGDSYGLNEHTGVMGQCPEGRFHVASEYGIFEILRDDGTPAEPGEEGRVVTTSLHNRAFPLIRYDTGDLAVCEAGPCACGRTLPVIRSLSGRLGDRVLGANGRWVSSLHRAVKFVRGIRGTQLVQERAGTLDVYIVPAEGYGPAVESRVVSDMRTELGEPMDIRVHLVKELPFPAERKFKFVISRLQGAGDP
jgi:phenylacetate-CoA ligase